MTLAQALWITAPNQVEVRKQEVSAGPGDVLVETLYSGISRGTERLVHSGRVPESEYETMRAPFQEGAFSGPVKYGYSAVGRAPDGSLVFALYPHQTRFALSPANLFPVPDGVPPERAVLAANMETALNITWDAGIGLGDRIVVVGCGVVGALVGYLAARIPGTNVTLVDVDANRSGLAAAFACSFALPDAAPRDADVVIHASATASGLDTAIACAGVEATIVEASWFGTGPTEVPLGGRFHQRRLRLISSQVGRIPAHQAARWTYARRLSMALELLADPVLDRLVSGETRFADLADRYDDILSDPATLCHRVRYGG